MKAGSLSVFHPNSASEALQMVRDIADARFVAGGTALQLEWAKGLSKPAALVTLGRIDGMSGISEDKGVLQIGALTPLVVLCSDAQVERQLPMLRAAARTLAAPSIRNLATIGGNLTGRTGCLLPALLALDAELEIVGAAGVHRETLSDWLSRLTSGNDHEIITSVHLPAMPPAAAWTQRKIGMRAAFTPSVVGVAGMVHLAGETILSARLAVGGGVVRPARLGEVEAWLAGRVLPELDWDDVHDRLVSAIDAPDDAFRTGRYRRMVAANALVRGLSGRAVPARPKRPRHYPVHGSDPSGEVSVSHAALADRWHIRPDVMAKISGEFSYLTDWRSPDMLVGRILRAGIPHACILSIDTSAAEALPGVVAVVTHKDVPGDNAFGIVVQDQPAFCFDKVRYAGDVVAAVAAVNAATAEAALALIRVEYDPLPVVTDPLLALEPDAPAVHASGNLQSILHFSRGDMAAGFAGAAHIVERTYVTSRQMHGFMETEGGHAQVEDDGSLSVFVGGQHGVRDRLQLSRILGLPEDAIRVVTSPTGGAFGGKDELTVQPALALLALKSGKPVHLQLSRAESVIAGVKRNPMTIRMRTACDADGMLLAQEVDVLSDCGAYASLSPGVLETALEHAAGPYLIPNIETHGRLAYTNNGVCGAFRGFGANQMTYAVECQMDALALLCGLTPVDIRRRNLRQPGSPGYLGQKVSPSERLVEMLDAAEASPLWHRIDEPIDPDDIIGVGMALNYQGNGLGSVVPDPSGGRLRLTEDGKIEAAYGLDEMGQGLLTSIKTAVSAELGCGRDDVVPVIGDTSLAPDSGSTTASRGGYVVWRVARQAGAMLSADILASAAILLDRPADGLKVIPGGIGDRLSNSGEVLLSFGGLAGSLRREALPLSQIEFQFPKTDYTTGNARYIFAYGACLARVAVNRVSGAVRVLDLAQHTAAGPIIDVAAYLGQMEGGLIQGLGFTLTEDAMMQDGLYQTVNLDTYMLPGIRDTPDGMSVFALEDLDQGDTLGPRGAGELGIGAITPAIANAVADAIGVLPPKIPFCPEAMLDAIGAGR